MRSQFKVEALKTEELAEAWAIVRSAGSYANEDWWVEEAADLIAHGGGILVARAADRRPYGVATFEVPKRPIERSLFVRNLITFELNSSEPARSALLAALKRIAIKLECEHMILPLDRKSADRPTRN